MVWEGNAVIAALPRESSFIIPVNLRKSLNPSDSWVKAELLTSAKQSCCQDPRDNECGKASLLGKAAHLRDPSSSSEDQGAQDGPV